MMIINNDNSDMTLASSLAFRSEPCNYFVLVLPGAAGARLRGITHTHTRAACLAVKTRDRDPPKLLNNRLIRTSNGEIRTVRTRCIPYKLHLAIARARDARPILSRSYRALNVSATGASSPRVHYLMDFLCSMARNILDIFERSFCRRIPQ